MRPSAAPLGSIEGLDHETTELTRGDRPRTSVRQLGSTVVTTVVEAVDLRRTYRTTTGTFRRGSVEVEASTEPVPLEVQPLPAGAPAGFKGAVGQFTLESKLVPEQVNEGEPITWTLSLKGTGN